MEVLSRFSSVRLCPSASLADDHNGSRHVPAQARICPLRCDHDSVGDVPLLVLADRLDPFDAAGQLAAGQTATLTITYAPATGVASPQAVTLDFGSAQNPSPLTGFAQASTPAMTAQDGFAAGSLQAFSIAPDGTVVGVYDNGRTQVIDRLALARFANPAGLVRLGQNLFRESENSGPPDVGAPGDGGRGTLIPSALERSNVDLAREFTDLVVAQRGFEAAARIIGVSDQVLQTVVNLKQ